MTQHQLLNWNIAGLPKWLWWIKGLRFVDGRYRKMSRILAEADFVCLQEAFRHRGTIRGKKITGVVPWVWIGGDKKSGLIMMSREKPLEPPREGDFTTTTFSQGDFLAKKGWLAARFRFGWLLTTHLDAGPDSDSDTDTDTEPICDGWHEVDAGLCWEEPPPEDLMQWGGAAVHCNGLGDGWRLPLIQELRGLIRGCPAGSDRTYRSPTPFAAASATGRLRNGADRDPSPSSEPSTPSTKIALLAASKTSTRRGASPT